MDERAGGKRMLNSVFASVFMVVWIIYAGVNLKKDADARKTVWVAVDVAVMCLWTAILISYNWG